jgi:hypothetical protein
VWNKNDGVAKTHQLLRCCNCSRHCGVPKYASFLDLARLAFGAFCLAIHSFCFLAKASKISLQPIGPEKPAGLP